MIPYIKRNGAKSFKVTEFSGGVNLMKEKKLIRDDQLSSAKNMWFSGGALKTRPAVAEAIKNNNIYEHPEISVDNMNEIVYKSKSYLLETVKEKVGDTTVINLRFVSESDFIFLDRIVISHENAPVFSVIFKDNVYVFVGTVNEIYKLTKLSEGVYSKATLVSENEIYAPLVLTNCWSCFNDSGKINAMLLKGADKLEDFNLLSNRYRMCFSQYDAKNYIEVNEGDSESRVSYMEYGLPYTSPGTNGKIYLEYTCYEGYTHRHSVDCPDVKAPTVESNIGDDGLYLHAFVKGDICHVTLNSSKEATHFDADIVSVEKYINNNMIINAPRTNPIKNLEKVTLMREKVWFGNNSLGVNGGSRLFLGGNIKEKSLLIWSDFENPLYFPESNYAYVGDKAQEITAFKRMGAELVIFKEKEIYSTKYAFNEESLNIATFPLALIHPEIGCRHPESIQLVRNRLVFYNDGQVYVICEQNQFSERNVYPVSSLINPELKKRNALKVYSADWNGLYLLFVDETVFLMNYNTYAYVNISAGSDENHMEIPWFIWELPQKTDGVKSVNGELLLWVKSDSDEGISSINIMKLNDETVDKKVVFEVKDEAVVKFKSEKIISAFETKHFDLGDPHRIKIIEKVLFDSIKDHKMTVQVISEENIPDSHSAFFNSIVPENRYLRSVGLLFETTGRLCLTGLEIRYRMGK